MILVEFIGAVDESGATRTFYLSTEAFITAATDTPANTAFKPRLIDPGNIGLSIYSDGAAGGSSKLEVGEIVAANIDAEFDALKDYSFDGREVVVRVGEGGAYPGAFQTVMTATMDRVDVLWDKLVIHIRPKSYILDKPILTERFAGDNVLPDGLEGTADDIKGRLKPRALGEPRIVAPPCVNTSKLTYLASYGGAHDIPAVYVGGAALSRGVDHPTAAALQAAVVVGGSYQTCLAEGLFRIGAVDGVVSCDVVIGPNASDRSAAQLMRALALEAGVGADKINEADVAALDARNPAPLGRWVDDDSTFLTVMDEIAQSIGAWYDFDLNGVLRMGRLDAPTGTTLYTLRDFEILDGPERSAPEDYPIPVWSVTVKHTRVWEVQTSGLVDSVNAATRAFLGQDYRAATATREAVRTQFRMAAQVEVETLLTRVVDAETEAARLLDLRDTPQDVLRLPVDMAVLARMLAAGVYLGGEVGVEMPRFGLSQARAFILLGIRYERRARTAVLTLWGGDEVAIAPTSYVSGVGLAQGAGVAAAAGQLAAGIVGAAGMAAGTGQAAAVGQTGAGVIAAVGTAQGTGSAAAVGATPGAGVGGPVGLLLAVTRAS